MDAVDPVVKELEDLEEKLRSARKAAVASEATEKDHADLKLIEQEHLAAQLRMRRPEGNKTSTPLSDLKKKQDRKLDEALKDSFPSSDPVSFVQAAPIKQEDRGLPEVKLAEQQAQARTKAAAKSE